MKFNSVTALDQFRTDLQKQKAKSSHVIAICTGTGCLALGVKKVIATFQQELEKQHLKTEIQIRSTGCPGFCENGPVVVVYPEGIHYHHVKPEDILEIIAQTLLKGKVIDRLLFTNPLTQKKVKTDAEISFYRDQKRILLSDSLQIDPTQIDDYIHIGGYSALVKALFQLKPRQILEEVTNANLRGRGGGGFPTGRKWKTTMDANEDPKYVIINCDEGDPGAFMNRALMEGNPHKVLEGFIIGAYTIQAHQGFIYIRDEYPLAVENVKIALRQAEEYGLLGQNILGSGFNFTIEIHKGAGAFVCGESTALMTSIEGRVGEPRPKYIHTAEKGLWNKPTVLNNVETWANIPLIINQGAAWFRSIGSKSSAGTKIFSLVGKVVNTGLVEVPLGTSLRKIIFDIGGGIPKGKKFKAVQTGGPSGGCIPESLLDTPIDFDELTKLGSMMGSGGLIVMDEDTCMVDLAKYFTNFLAEESCGKCVPCRNGLRQLHRLLEEISTGHGSPDALEQLEELSGVVKDASLCGLGQSAPNPILTTLKYFRSEYQVHLQGECPAKVCKSLFHYEISPQACKACGLCKKECPNGAIRGKVKEIHEINQSLCIKCDMCFQVCPYDAVKKVSNKIKVKT